MRLMQLKRKANRPTNNWYLEINFFAVRIYVAKSRVPLKRLLQKADGLQGLACEKNLPGRPKKSTNPKEKNI